MEIPDRSIQVKGHAVHYRVVGTGEPVILVHGLSGSTRWWARNVPALAKRYRVHLVDLQGFGAMRRYRRSFILAEAASSLLAWMDALDLPWVHLVGHSMGGTFASDAQPKTLRLYAAWFWCPSQGSPPADPCRVSWARS